MLFQGPVQYTSRQASGRGSTDAAWRLLAQIDSDDAAGWMWGDAGAIYFTILDEDFAAGDLDQVWMVLHSG